MNTCKNSLPIPNLTLDYSTRELKRNEPEIHFVSVWNISFLTGNLETCFDSDRLLLQPTLNAFLPQKKSLPYFPTTNPLQELDVFYFVRPVSGKIMRSHRDKYFHKNLFITQGELSLPSVLAICCLVKSSRRKNVTLTKTTDSTRALVVLDKLG